MEKIKYKIVNIGEHPKKKDLVTIFLEPTDNLDIHLNGSQRIGMLSSNIPPEIRQVLQLMESVTTSSSNTNERSIVLLKPKIEFVHMGWKYGDIIEVSFKKIKEAENVKPEEEEMIG